MYVITNFFLNVLPLQEIAFNIQQTEALTRSLSPSNVGEQQSFSRSASHTSFDAQSLRRNKQRLEEEQAYARSLAEQVCFVFFSFPSILYTTKHMCHHI